MLAVLKLEFIGETYFAYKKYKGIASVPRLPYKTPISGGMERYGDYLGLDQSRPWVARLTGFDEECTLAREFVRGQKDYSQSNSTGSRGVYVYYPLKTGVYEVNERTSWTRVRRYFLHVEREEITEITKDEVLQWLNAKSR